MKLSKIVIGILALILGAYLVYKLAMPSKIKVTKESELVLINVLDKNLYDDCHISGSVNIPFDKFEEFADKLNKKDHIVVYCSNYMCTASGATAKMLKNKGFENVWAYEAGTAGWLQEGLKVEGPCSQAYLKLKTEKPAHQDADVKVISTAELREKLDKMSIFKPSIS